MFALDAAASLTAAQRAAVVAPDAPLLVLAGAGTGKTHTLACRVARLLLDGAQPERILLLTFTRRAAADLVGRARAAALAAAAAATEAAGAMGAGTGGAGAGGGTAEPALRPGAVVGGTFHAVANRMLRRHGHALGLGPSFTVMDAGDAADLLDVLRTDAGLADRGRRFPRKDTLAAIYSRTVNAAQPLSDVLVRHWPWCADEVEPMGEVFRAYTARKARLGVLDYDDLLLWWQALLDHPTTGPAVIGSFDHVLVDEYQDTCRLQGEIVRRLASDHGRITVVGDDAQAIYGFRSATVDNILRFCDHFPGANVVRLEDSHRSTAPIVATANAVMAGADGQWDKTLRSPRDGSPPELVTSIDEQAQAELICDRVLARTEDGVALRDQAVLMRTGHHSAQLELTLAQRGIPFVKYGGLRFLEAAHVKDLTALLRVLDNPDDEPAWFRVLQWFDGVGPVTARRLVDELTEGPGGRLRRFVTAPPELPRAARGEAESLRAAFGVCAGLDPVAAAAPPVATQIVRLADAYAPVCARRFSDAAARLRDLDQLAALAETSRDRTAFLTGLVLDPPSSTGDLAGAPRKDEDWLVLSTIHSAKGLEWDTVHVLGLADGMIPSDLSTGDREELAEERRLLYVAVTRAQRELVLHQPLRCYLQRTGVSDAHTYAQPSRFLDPRVRATLVHRSTGTVTGPVTATAAPPATVGDYLAGLWR